MTLKLFKSISIAAMIVALSTTAVAQEKSTQTPLKQNGATSDVGVNSHFKGLRPRDIKPTARSNSDKSTPNSGSEGETNLRLLGDVIRTTPPPENDPRFLIVPNPEDEIPARLPSGSNNVIVRSAPTDGTQDVGDGCADNVSNDPFYLRIHCLVASEKGGAPEK